MRKLVNCAAAVIVRDGKVLACQRGYGAYKDGWEFPGGKIEAHETGKEAAERELREEMNYHIRAQRLLEVIACAYETFDLRLECWLCVPEDASFELLEHEDARWLACDELGSVKWLAADQMLADDIRKGKVKLDEEA